MSETWHARVWTYVEQLEQTVKTIDSILEQTQVETVKVDSAAVDHDQSARQLEHALAELEERIARREELLKAPDAPPQGLTLTEKLRSTLRLEDAQLARHCEQVAGIIASANHRAVSLFICQYHLSEFSSEIVRLLSGTSLQTTYDSSIRRSSGASGGLFNESA